MMRLQKFLSAAGVASRRKSEELIKAGKITINDKITSKLGTTIDETKDKIKYKNKLVKIKSNKIYIALNKPVGYISSTDNRQGKSILKLVKAEQKVYPVGRLDKDSSGLIILTNDGDFTNQLTHAKFDCEKEYFVILDQDLKKEDIHRLERGLILRGKKLRPVKCVMAQNKSARLILKQGVYRQIRGMLGRLGYTVIKLKRIRIGKLELGDLQPGQWKIINKNDVI